MQTSDIEFKVGNKPVKFTVVNNLDEFGLSVEDAVVNWTERTKEFTPESFCKYVISKDPDNIMCIYNL